MQNATRVGQAGVSLTTKKQSYQLDIGNFAFKHNAY